jgi:hypothetical protein
VTETAIVCPWLTTDPFSGPVMRTANGEPPTVNGTELLDIPATVTTALPEVAPFGIATTILVALRHVVQRVAVVPLKVTVLDPCEGPKVTPVIVAMVPTGPEFGFKLVMLGTFGTTVKLVPLLATPETETATFPVVAPDGAAYVRVARLYSGASARLRSKQSS